MAKPLKGTLAAAWEAAFERIETAAGRALQYGDEAIAIAAGQFPRNGNGYAYVAALVVKAGAGTLYGFSGYNSGPTQFVLAFDLASLHDLGAASIPEILVQATGVGNFSYDAGEHGRRFTRGIILASSSTATIYTFTDATCWFDAQYV